MNETVKIFFGLIAGLALFLYGMNSMSDALQQDMESFVAFAEGAGK